MRTPAAARESLVVPTFTDAASSPSSRHNDELITNKRTEASETQRKPAPSYRDPKNLIISIERETVSERESNSRSVNND